MRAADYAPGTIAVVSFKGQRIRAARVGSGWQMLEVVDGQWTWTSAHDVTDIQPLVVLDLSDPKTAVQAIRSGRMTDPSEYDHLDHALTDVADQIEAQTKPPRIPEPGLWGVVEASMHAGTTRLTWVRTPEFWYAAKWDSARSWSDLSDPTLIREGVES